MIALATGNSHYAAQGQNLRRNGATPRALYFSEIKKEKLAKKMSFKRMTEVSDLPLSSV